MACLLREVIYILTIINNTFTNVGLHDIARSILILYCLASIFKTIIDAIFIYSFRYNTKIVVSRM